MLEDGGHGGAVRLLLVRARNLLFLESISGSDVGDEVLRDEAQGTDNADGVVAHWH